MSNPNLTGHSLTLFPLVLYHSLRGRRNRPTPVYNSRCDRRKLRGAQTPVLEAIATHWQSWWACDHRASQPGFAARSSGRGCTRGRLRARAPPLPTWARRGCPATGPPGQGAAEAASRQLREAAPRDPPGAHPRSFPLGAADGRGSGAGSRQSSAKGAPAGTGWSGWGALEERDGSPPSLHPSLPSSAVLEPPLGSAPSSSPLGNAGPSPSSRFRWQKLGPCPAVPPPLPQHSAPSGPAQGRAGETRPRGGEGRRGPAGCSRPLERGGGRSGAARAGGAGGCPGRGSRDAGPAAGDAGERRGPGGMGLRVARRGWGVFAGNNNPPTPSGACVIFAETGKLVRRDETGSAASACAVLLSAGSPAVPIPQGSGWLRLGTELSPPPGRTPVGQRSWQARAASAVALPTPWGAGGA